MGHVDKSKYGSARPKIEQSDLEDGDAAVFTIAAVQEEKVKDDEGERVSLVVVTEELGDKLHWLNQTQIGYLIEKFGDNSDEWIGQKFPLVKTTTHFGGRAFKKVWVAAPADWDGIFEAAGVPQRRSVTKRPRVAKVVKRGKRR